jgi:hypothetical protein
MAASLADAIDLVAPRLPPALVPAAALAAVRRVAASLPAALTSWVDFECRLQDDAAHVDLSLRVGRRQAGPLAAVAQRGGKGLLGPELFPTPPPAWRRLADLAADWIDCGRPSPIAGRIPLSAIWIEFDIPDGDATPLPRTFVDFPRNQWSAPAAAARISDALQIVGDQPWMRNGVRRCLEHLPSGIEMRYLGLPADEEVGVIRLCLLARDERQALACLEGVGWRGDLDPVRQLCERWRRSRSSGHTNGALLHLDVTPAAAPAARIGIEFPLRRRPQVKGVLADAGFLDELVECGACSTARRAALAGWPGCEIATQPHRPQPHLLMRRVSHVKAVFDRDRAPEAKAYLCAARLAGPPLAPTDRSPALLGAAAIAS